MNKKILVLSFLIVSSLLISQDQAPEQSIRNVSPTIEIRYDDFLNDMSPTSSIGLLFQVDENRYAGFDVNTVDDETRILLGWNWTVLGIGTSEISEDEVISIFSFGVKYSVLKGMYSTVEYVMVDSPDISDYSRLAIGVKF